MDEPATIPTISSPAGRVVARLRALRLNWPRIIGISLVLVWALIIGHEYLDLNPQMVPAGREFSSAIQAHHLWTRAQQCGWCALWDGSERGGFPALADTLASSLHPLVILTTLGWGVVNGAKIALIAALAMAGLAQLWLGRELKLGWLASIWAALMVMVSGHLAGKMELGLFSVLLSTATLSLTFPAALRLARTRRYRDAVLLALILALSAVAGQGYMQAGFLLISPAYLALLWGSRATMATTWRRFLLAAGLALLLAAPFLVPLAHFWPNLVKDSDPELGAAISLNKYLLNLFVDDPDLLFGSVLNPLPYPHMYTLFVGWIPVALAALCLRFGRREHWRPLLFLAGSAALAIFVGSMVPLRWLLPVAPFLAALRFGPMMGGLALPPLLGLAAYGLNGLWQAGWLRSTLYVGLNQAPAGRRVNWGWLLLIPLFMALQQGYRFSQEWLFVQEQSPAIQEVLAALQTPSLAWVQPPFGKHEYVEPAVAMGLKLSPGIMTWRWRDRELPPPSLEASSEGPPTEVISQATVGDVVVYGRNVPVYARVIASAGWEACQATGSGGHLTVRCNNQQTGILELLENQWTGWRVWRDGQLVSLQDGQWLRVVAPAGEHVYEFRYQPLDVPLGLTLLLVGCILCAALWTRPDHI